MYPHLTSEMWDFLPWNYNHIVTTFHCMALFEELSNTFTCWFGECHIVNTAHMYWLMHNQQCRWRQSKRSKLCFGKLITAQEQEQLWGTEVPVQKWLLTHMQPSKLTSSRSKRAPYVDDSERHGCDRAQTRQSDPTEVARGQDMSECRSSKKSWITNSECQPDCQRCDWTNTLRFSKAASVCAHRLQHVKPYQKHHSIQQSTAQHNAAQTTKIKSHSISAWHS